MSQSKTFFLEILGLMQNFTESFHIITSGHKVKGHSGSSSKEVLTMFTDKEI